MSKKVMVLKGGFSSEREVSLVSGKGVEEALKKDGYEVVACDLKDVREFLKAIELEKPDVVFNALHGNWGEDGEIQAMLDMLQIPYTHSGMEASLVGMNKDLSKMLAVDNGVKVAESEKKTYDDFKKNGTKINLPYVLKPVADGSSVGVFIIHKPEDLKMVKYEDESRELLIEKFISGKELTVAVFNDEALAVTELCPKVEFYDYEAKYTNGMTNHILPAEIPEEVAEKAKSYAVIMHKVLGCNTVSRSDFRYNSQDGVIFLEINTNPGMTPLSLVPEQAKFRGVSYEKLCDELVRSAKCRKM